MAAPLQSGTVRDRVDSGTPGADDAERGRTLAELVSEALRAAPAGELTVSDATRSMVPLLGGGEVLAWERRPGPPRRGDLVIVLGHPAGPLVHRVIGVRAGHVVTKGDNCRAADAPVPPEAIAGTVVAVAFRSRRVRFDRGLPRWHARAAAAWSAAGAALDRAIGGRAAWWVQAAGQRVLHALAFLPRRGSR